MPQRRPHDITLTEQASACTALAERQARLAEEHAALANRIETLSEAHRKAMIRLIGQAKVREARPEHEKLLAQLEEVETRYDDSPEGQRKALRRTRKLIRQRHKLYDSVGFDHAKAVKMRREAMEKADAIYAKHAGGGEDVEYASKSADGLPITDNPWTHYSAPYAGDWGWQGSGRTRGTASAWRAENRVSGQIGSHGYLRVVRADNSDSAWTRTLSEIQVGFRMPAAGMVEAWATFQDIDTGISGNLLDESGCSEGRVGQQVRAYLWTSGGVERYQNLASSSVRSDGTSKVWNNAMSSPGAFRYPHLFSSRSYAAGEWVWVAIGVQADSDLWVDDMSVNPARTDGRYFVKDVWLRSTGAP